MLTIAQLIIDIPNNIATRVTNDLCERFNYQDLINGQPNTETKAQFAKRIVASQIKSWLVEHELSKLDLDLSRTYNTSKTTELNRITSELNIT